MIKIFYDGKCSLCSKEINYYRRISPALFAKWLDIATDPSPLEALGISQDDALKRLHVQDDAGNIKTGINAFLVIWEGLSGWRLVGRIIGFPLIYDLAEYLYVRFAEYRFKRVHYCKVIGGG